MANYKNKAPKYNRARECVIAALGFAALGKFKSATATLQQASKLSGFPTVIDELTASAVSDYQTAFPKKIQASADDQFEQELKTASEEEEEEEGPPTAEIGDEGLDEEEETAGDEDEDEDEDEDDEDEDEDDEEEETAGDEDEEEPRGPLEGEERSEGRDPETASLKARSRRASRNERVIAALRKTSASTAKPVKVKSKK